MSAETEMIEQRHEWAIFAHNAGARLYCGARRAARFAHDLADARHDLDTERKASAMLADRVLDLARELEALRAAVRAHEADARASGHATPPRDLALWAAAKA